MYIVNYFDFLLFDTFSEVCLYIICVFVYWKGNMKAFRVSCM